MFQDVCAFDPRANRETRSFDISRDGFSLLVMGYTGHKALDFKLTYIRRFNEMEEALRMPVVPAMAVLDNFDWFLFALDEAKYKYLHLLLK